MSQPGQSYKDIDQMSRLLGNIEAQLTTLSASVVGLTNSFHTDRELATTTRREMAETMEDIKSVLDPLAVSVECMKPIVDDYKSNKNKAIGFLLAVTIVSGICGFVLSKMIEVFTHR